MQRAVSTVTFAIVVGFALVALASVPSTPDDLTADGPDPDAGSEGGTFDSSFDSGSFDGGGFDSPSTDSSGCSQFTTLTPLCGEGGTSGCAGLGAEGGVGGLGGGAAVALYIVGDSHVTVANGAFFVAHGGQGGPGGDGGTGSPGHGGTSGSAQQCFTGCDPSCNKTGPYFLDGGTAGTGAAGGNGGLGGGGAGGPIYFYACVDAGPPTFLTPSTLDASAVVEGGGPGQGGSPNGKSGAQGVGYP